MDGVWWWLNSTVALLSEVADLSGKTRRRARDQGCALAGKSTLNRLELTPFAYVLIQTLRRLGLEGTPMAKAQCDTIRLKLFKIGAQIRISVRRVRIAFSDSYPHANMFRRILYKLQLIPLR